MLIRVGQTLTLLVNIKVTSVMCLNFLFVDIHLWLAFSEGLSIILILVLVRMGLGNHSVRFVPFD
jgi:hypothetical protein